MGIFGRRQTVTDVQPVAAGRTGSPRGPRQRRPRPIRLCGRSMDRPHSRIGFSVRHIMVTTVRGSFADEEMTFRSTSTVQESAESFRMTGDLTIRGTTRPVALQLACLGSVVDPFG
ncbi:YceI family protein [Streptomyces violaceorubidus]|uniref:YceI family protein n=1 Tax=Streptomyces violaceorubidus TaxID=284042 RepID=A0ABV1SRX8_9ACTN